MKNRNTSVYTTWWLNKFLRPANSLEELIEIFDEQAQELREMKTAGVQLEFVGEDYYLLSTENPDVAKRFGMDEEDNSNWEFEPEYGGEG